MSEDKRALAKAVAVVFAVGFLLIFIMVAILPKPKPGWTALGGYSDSMRQDIQERRRNDLNVSYRRFLREERKKACARRGHHCKDCK